MRRRHLLFLLTPGLQLVPAPGHAWNETGHLTVAEIAFRATEAQGRAFATGILRQHPDHDRRWLPEMPPGTPEDEYLFLRAAIWPDEIRGADHPSHSRHRRNWHFINFPFVPPGESINAPSPTGPHILRAIYGNFNVMRSGTSPAAEKAIALCWLFHLAGDIQQPLHCTGLFSREFPAGDKGGNDFLVRQGNRQTNLHSFWDGLLGRDSGFGNVRSLATDLMQRHPSSELPELQQQDVDVWAFNESFRLAKIHGYLSGQLQGSRSRRDAPRLPPGYEAEAKRVADRRIALGGYRLARWVADLAAG